MRPGRLSSWYVNEQEAECWVTGVSNIALHGSRNRHLSWAIRLVYYIMVSQRQARDSEQESIRHRPSLAIVDISIPQAAKCFGRNSRGLRRSHRASAAPGNPTQSEPTTLAWPSGEGQTYIPVTLAGWSHSVNADDAWVAVFRSENQGAKGVLIYEALACHHLLRVMGDGREGRERTVSPLALPPELHVACHGRGVFCIASSGRPGGGADKPCFLRSSRWHVGGGRYRRCAALLVRRVEAPQLTPGPGNGRTHTSRRSVGQWRSHDGGG